jgi:GNAT superfamily N-acetyltransferase
MTPKSSNFRFRACTFALQAGIEYNCRKASLMFKRMCMMDLLIRPAQPEDREAALAFTAHTWGEHGDYIHMVWEDWLHSDRGPLLVGVLDGEPVSLVKVTWNSPGEAWMEGMRVHPDRRGQGIARLALAMRVLVRRCNPPGVEGMVRDEAELWAVLEGVGYEKGWSALFWVLEGSLEG